MTNENEPGTAAPPGPNDRSIENNDQPTTQAPGYNETERGSDDPGGEANQIEPAWRPGDEPAGTPANSGMQGEGEPGRSERDSTGGVEGPTGSEDQ